MKKQLPHFCIDLNGNVLHAVILFKIQKLKKKPCCLIFASWPCDVYCPELTEPLYLTHAVLWMLLHSSQCNCANTPCCDVVDKLQ